MDKCGKNSNLFYVSVFSIAIVLGIIIFYNYFLQVKNIKEGFIGGLFGKKSEKYEKYETFVEKKRKEKNKENSNLVGKAKEMLKIALK